MVAPNKPYIFNPKAGNEFGIFAELISSCFVKYEKQNWSRLYEIEFGFTYKDKESETDYFFGIWYEVWQHYGIPLCISINYYGAAPGSKSNQIRKFIEEYNEKGLRYADFKSYNLVLFDYEFFSFDPEGSDIEKVDKVFSRLERFISK